MIYLTHNIQYSLMNAKTSLAILLQVQEDMLPDIKGKLDDGSILLSYSYDDIKESLKKQPELISLSYQEESKKKALSLEEKTRYPDVTLGINYSNDGLSSARESLVALSVSIPIPVFQRNFSAIGQATTDLVQASIKRQEAYNRSQKDMNDLWRKINSMKESINILKNNIMPLSLKNDELALSSQRIGQIGLMDLILINRQAVSANQKLLDVLLEYQVTRLTLERIIGLE